MRLSNNEFADLLIETADTLNESYLSDVKRVATFNIKKDSKKLAEFISEYISKLSDMCDILKKKSFNENDVTKLNNSTKDIQNFVNDNKDYMNEAIILLRNFKRNIYYKSAKERILSNSNNLKDLKSRFDEIKKNIDSSNVSSTKIVNESIHKSVNFINWNINNITKILNKF